ncbi:acyl-CoA dehydrogenase [Mycobacterium sp. IS-1496]|uniref:acyl-CoA dehydrogenase family protein n=1 Tax=Mycobacterium sp. IS-1496 TaxID=1772284 RepID=UPI000741797A|nr:acyl-CoA dehydrogenase family protein [Mycobacterium sp. IS-1496]KUI38421.1 acyl-CoA dehydrogenase [Mycobacterium sp. IS-1496]
MNLEPTEEQQALRDAVRRFLGEKAPISGHVRPMLTDARGTTDDVWRGLAALGTTALLIPSDLGGDGMSMLEAGVVLEEMGAALHPGPWLSSAVAAPRALARFRASSEAADLAVALAGGQTIATVALPGENPPAVSHRGDGRVALRGALDDVSDARAADVLLVPVRGRADVELVAVETSDPRVSMTPIPGIDRTHKRCRVRFDDAPGRVLAAADQHAARALTDDVLVARAADAVGAAGRILAMTVDYAKVRRQFGQPIGSFQAVAHLCVDMLETVELARSGVLYALWAADSADPAESHRAALRVKAFGGHLAGVADSAIQIFGGVGFTWEHDAQLYLRRLLDYSRFLGHPGEYAEQLGAALVADREGTLGAEARTA